MDGQGKAYGDLIGRVLWGWDVQRYQFGAYKGFEMDML